MQTAPRIVVIDDKAEHLTAIVQAFNSLGTSCHSVLYDPSTGVPPERLRGVRALFLDLHLLDGTPGSASERHFTLLEEILRTGISKTGGPYVLVLWTENAEKYGRFRQFLEERLFGEEPHTRPLAFVKLDKTEFLSESTGSPEAGEKLLEAVQAVTQGNPQLNALLAWERDVMAAAGSTLSTIMDLVPPHSRTTEDASEPLDELLSRLAREQVGKGNVAADVRTAISTVLAPILADRIINRDPPDGAPELWEEAVTKYRDPLPEIDDAEVGSVNRMLHVSVGGLETLNSDDWGAVVRFPQAECTKDGLMARFGASAKELLGQEFKIDKPAREKIDPVLVRIGASCDHAQRSSGPLTYLLGAIIPTSAERVLTDGELKRPASIWVSPTLCLPGQDEGFTLEVNARFPFVTNRADAASLEVRFRLREQLLVHLLNAAGAYVVRPGIVSL